MPWPCFDRWVTYLRINILYRKTWHHTLSHSINNHRNTSISFVVLSGLACGRTTVVQLHLCWIKSNPGRRTTANVCRALHIGFRISPWHRYAFCIIQCISLLVIVRCDITRKISITNGCCYTFVKRTVRRKSWIYVIVMHSLIDISEFSNKG